MPVDLLLGVMNHTPTAKRITDFGGKKSSWASGSVACDRYQAAFRYAMFPIGVLHRLLN